MSSGTVETLALSAAQAAKAIGVGRGAPWHAAVKQ
jgi:hypothetical protein